MISAHLVVILAWDHHRVVHFSSKLTSSRNSRKQIEQRLQQFVGRKVLRPYDRDCKQMYVPVAPSPRRNPRKP